jgi:hypothetical protein
LVVGCGRQRALGVPRQPTLDLGDRDEAEAALPNPCKLVVDVAAEVVWAYAERLGRL